MTTQQNYDTEDLTSKHHYLPSGGSTVLLNRPKATVDASLK